MRWIRKHWGRISHISVGFTVALLTPVGAIAVAILVVGREWLQEDEYRLKDQRLAILNKSWRDLCEWIIGFTIGAIANAAIGFGVEELLRRAV